MDILVLFVNSDAIWGRSPNYYMQFYIGMNKAKLLFAVIPKYFVVVVILKGLILFEDVQAQTGIEPAAQQYLFQGHPLILEPSSKVGEPSPYDLQTALSFSSADDQRN